MLIRWFFSETYTDPELHHVFPVCRAYGHHWHLPRCPETPGGSVLVQMACGQHQIEAAKQDPRVLVLPPVMDRSPLPDGLVQTYASMGAHSGMDLGWLLSKLAESEPRFAHEMRVT